MESADGPVGTPGLYFGVVNEGSVGILPLLTLFGCCSWFTCLGRRFGDKKVHCAGQFHQNQQFGLQGIYVCVVLGYLFFPLHEM